MIFNHGFFSYLLTIRYTSSYNELKGGDSMENNYNNEYSCEVRERSEVCISCLLAGITAGVLVAIAAALLFFFGVIKHLIT